MKIKSPLSYVEFKIQPGKGEGGRGFNFELKYTQTETWFSIIYYILNWKENE